MTDPNQPGISLAAAANWQLDRQRTLYSEELRRLHREHAECLENYANMLSDPEQYTLEDVVACLHEEARQIRACKGGCCESGEAEES